MNDKLWRGAQPEDAAVFRQLGVKTVINLRRDRDDFPDLQGTVTDVLIGDVFDGHVDKLWKPMETLYEPGKGSIPTWDAGLPADEIPEKANELLLPEDRGVVVHPYPKQ